MADDAVVDGRIVTAENFGALASAAPGCIRVQTLNSGGRRRSNAPGCARLVFVSGWRVVEIYRLRAGVGVDRFAADSVLAKHDIRGGDLSTHANGRRVESSTTFRRHL